LSVTRGVTPFPYRILTGVTPGLTYENSSSKKLQESFLNPWQASTSIGNAI